MALNLSISREDGTAMGGTSATSLDIGIITGIAITYSSEVTQKAVLIWGWKGAFCMDMGVSKTFKLEYTRVSPMPFDNSSSNSKLWSNAYWRDAIKTELGEWQARHYAYRLNISMDAPDTDLFPTMSNVGYISSFTSPLSADKIQAISGIMEFNVGRLTNNGS